MKAMILAAGKGTRGVPIFTQHHFPNADDPDPSRTPVMEFLLELFGQHGF